MAAGRVVLNSASFSLFFSVSIFSTELALRRAD